MTQKARIIVRFKGLKKCDNTIVQSLLLDWGLNTFRGMLI
ncbi:hypothetical protein MNB_SUP05-SYMBIONT-5-1119 [hydrothermal vent metagenome]|uniref:Uncharacterized protein n=1 Tax=hydrothermal vent metagenome TaxID=652676 RepID=A0A1W1E5T9_9ZZZZ